MILKFETTVQIFRKIIQLNVVVILKSTNEYYRKMTSKSGLKKDLYPAMFGDYITIHVRQNGNKASSLAL